MMATSVWLGIVDCVVVAEVEAEVAAVVVVVVIVVLRLSAEAGAERGDGGVSGAAGRFRDFARRRRGLEMLLEVVTSAACCSMVDWWNRSTMRKVDNGNCCRSFSLSRGTRRLPDNCQIKCKKYIASLFGLTCDLRCQRSSHWSLGVC